MEQNQFKIRAYSVCELAQLYFPNNSKESAAKKLKRWFDESEEFLSQIQLRKFAKTLKPWQVKLIIDWFGEP